MRRNPETCGWSSWSFRVITRQSNSQNLKKIDGCGLHRSVGTEKSHQHFKPCWCWALRKVSFRYPELAGIRPHSVTKWCNVWLSLCTQPKFLCCWFGSLIQGQVFVQPNWTQINSLSCLVSICEKSLYLILLYAEKKYQLYFMQSLH